nr:tyrosine-type recombinase/integrase [uncultured Devosia sp.]
MAKVYKSKISGKYVAPLRDAVTGRRTTVTVGAGEEAHEEAKRVCAKSDSEWRENKRKGKPETVEASCAAYLDYLEKKNASRPHLSNAAKNARRNHIEPFFDGKRTRDVSVRDLHRFFAWMLDKGLNLETVDNMFSVFSMVLEWAKSRDVIAVNPMDEYRRFETKALLDAHRTGAPGPMPMPKIMEVLCHTSGMARAIFHLFLKGGVRIGEAAELTWGHVDFVTGKLEVFTTAEPKTVDQMPDRRDWKNKGVTKTSASVRRVPMSAELQGELTAYRDSLDERFRGPDSPLFANPDGTPLRILQLEYRIRSTQRKLNGHPPACPDFDDEIFTPHELRHTYCALMLAASFEIADISRWLGHKNIGITMVKYGHFLVGVETLLDLSSPQGTDELRAVA